MCVAIVEFVADNRKVGARNDMGEGFTEWTLHVDPAQWFFCCVHHVANCSSSTSSTSDGQRRVSIPTAQWLLGHFTSFAGEAVASRSGPCICSRIEQLGEASQLEMPGFAHGRGVVSTHIDVDRRPGHGETFWEIREFSGCGVVRAEVRN